VNLMISLRHVFQLVLLSAASATVLAGQARRFEGPGPVELHVHATAADGSAAALEETFLKVFYPAVSRQPGFKHSNLLRIPGKSGEYVLTIAFESEDLRLRWVATDLHQEVWPRMQSKFKDGKPGGVEALGIVTAPAK
jgi:heme-degrading monooxygenase HmoA